MGYKEERAKAAIEVLTKYKTQVAAFRKFCIEVGYKPAFEEEDFNGIALGFFAASGVRTDDLDDPEIDPDLFHLSRICRYDFQYWEGDTLGKWGPEPVYYMLDKKGRITIENEAGEVVASQKERR